jgi:hypothetical protein
VGLDSETPDNATGTEKRENITAAGHHQQLLAANIYYLCRFSRGTGSPVAKLYPRAVYDSA